MAVATDNEKLALITYHQPWNTPIPIVAGALDQGNKQHLIGEYPGILWTAIIGLGVLADTLVESLTTQSAFDSLTVERETESLTSKRTIEET